MMEHAWTLVALLFFSAQLVSAFIRPSYRSHSQSPKHLTVFSATLPPNAPASLEEFYDWRVRTEHARPRTTVSPWTRYPTKSPKTQFERVPSTCPDCSQQLEKYRAEINSNVVLNFSSTGVQKIGPLFINSSHVKTLYLNDNNITEVSAMAFHGLSKLEFLTLSNNNITTGKLLSLKRHEALKILLLDDNKYNLDNGSLEQVFDSMPRLQELSLKRAGITRFAVNLKEFAPSLTMLYLSGNKIKSADFLNDAPDALSHVHLDSNNIDSLTGYKLDNVQELFVNENEITTMCTKKSCTKAERSQLTLDGMTKLVKLNASCNKISNVAQDTFADTKSLVELDLSDNKITELPNDVFRGLSLLETLRISKNQLTFVPNLCSMSRLKSLDLSNNRIVVITRNSFCNRQLIDSNRLSIDDDGFRSLRMLQWLDLSGNQIVNFPVDLIYEPTFLKVLLLKDNNIFNINDLFNIRSNTLKELHLEGNPLLFISFREMPNLKIHLAKCKEKTTLEDTSVATTITTTTEIYSGDY